MPNFLIPCKAKCLVCYEPQTPDHAVWSSEITSVVVTWLGDVIAVPREQVVEFRVDMFGRAILVDCPVGPCRVVGQRLEGAGV